jgi:hypothetical protein
MRSPRVLMRLLSTLFFVGVVLAAAGCSSSGQPDTVVAPTGVDTAKLRATMSVLAADSLQGRFTGSEGAAAAARYIADELERLGLEPTGDSGYFQRVPIQVTKRADGRPRFNFYPSVRAWGLLPPDQQLMAVNVVARLPGADTTNSETVVVGAHYDHLGIRRSVDGDSIYNGADDASGAAGALEIARVLAAGPGLKRSVVFLFSSGEAIGFIGTRYYVEYPVAPLDETVAALWLENIGRPDPLVGPGVAWITGSDRTNIGRLFEDAEIDIEVEPDPRPEQRVYLRTESVVLAERAVPAHTLSSFGFHDDWHEPSDEIETINFAHFGQVVTSAIVIVRYLATGVPPQWYRGGRPEPSDF